MAKNRQDATNFEAALPCMYAVFCFFSKAGYLPLYKPMLVALSVATTDPGAQAAALGNGTRGALTGARIIGRWDDVVARAAHSDDAPPTEADDPATAADVETTSGPASNDTLAPADDDAGGDDDDDDGMCEWSAVEWAGYDGVRVTFVRNTYTDAAADDGGLGARANATVGDYEQYIARVHTDALRGGGGADDGRWDHFLDQHIGIKVRACRCRHAYGLDAVRTLNVDSHSTQSECWLECVLVKSEMIPRAYCVCSPPSDQIRLDRARGVHARCRGAARAPRSERPVRDPPGDRRYRALDAHLFGADALAARGGAQRRLQRERRDAAHLPLRPVELAAALSGDAPGVYGRLQQPLRILGGQELGAGRGGCLALSARAFDVPKGSTKGKAVIKPKESGAIPVPYLNPVPLHIKSGGRGVL